jgi:5-methylcytosine-specific restriction endonuclease McrA
MNRKPNTTRQGNSFTLETRNKVWAKGSVIQNYDSKIWRRDKCGRAMKWSEYGNRNSDYGWEIDHINPVSNNGTDDLSNLQPLYWKNNSDKGDKLKWSCP